MRGEVSVIFLDRDGTLNVDRGYVCSPQHVELIEGVSKAVSQMKQLGFLTVIVSNQSAVGRGYGTRADVDATNDEILRQLLEEDPNATIDGVFYCPHAPEENCDCRKPLPGLAVQIKKMWKFNPQRSWVIGDKLRDLEFGANIGIPSSQRVLVRTGSGDEQLQLVENKDTMVVKEDLKEAVEYINEMLRKEKKQTGNR